MPLPESARLLTGLVDRLLQQHRSGLNPTFGQLEDLADFNARVARDLHGVERTGDRAEVQVPTRLATPTRAGTDASAPPTGCHVPGCTGGDLVRVEGVSYCLHHALIVRGTLDALVDHARRLTASVVHDEAGKGGRR